jgi:hypothetical protein
MSYLKNSTQTVKKTNATPAILRAFDIAEADVASVDLGRIAVSDQADLEANIVPASAVPAEDTNYLGVVEINHSEIKDAEPTTEENAEPVDENKKDNEVRQRYLRSETEVYKPTGNDPYPNLSPLLAPN